MSRAGVASIVVVVVAVAVMGVVAWMAKAPGSRASTEDETDGNVRIVVLSPALAVTMVDLGLESSIVGRHGWDYVLDKRVPVCGDQAGIDYETLLRAKPTHVVLEWGRRELASKLVEMAEREGWKLLDFDLLTVQEIGESVVALAREFDGLVDVRRPELEGAGGSSAQDLVERMFPRGGETFGGRVLLLWPSSPPAAVGPGSFHQEILERVGGVAAIEEGSAYIELDAEDVLGLAPDGIVLIAAREVGSEAREYSWEQIEAMLGAIAGLDVPAVRERRVAVVDDPLVLTPSTAMIDFQRALVEVLGEWRAGESGR
jgi:ABC-type hemin transport system substrate-binding protein